jgi:hypothetical protein
MLYDPKADKKKQFIETLKKQSVNKKVPSKLSEPKSKSKVAKGSKGTTTNQLKKAKVKVNV